MVLGRILPEFFPCIFGPNEDEPLDKEGSMRAMTEITEEVNRFCREQNLEEKTVFEVAAGESDTRILTIL